MFPDGSDNARRQIDLLKGENSGDGVIDTETLPLSVQRIVRITDPSLAESRAVEVVEHHRSHIMEKSSGEGLACRYIDGRSGSSRRCSDEQRMS